MEQASTIERLKVHSPIDKGTSRVIDSANTQDWREIGAMSEQLRESGLRENCTIRLFERTEEGTRPTSSDSTILKENE